MLFKKFFAALLSIIQLAFTSVSYVKNKPVLPPLSSSGITGNIDENTPMADTIRYAASCANTVQGAYTDGGRGAYQLSNKQMRLTHRLSALVGKTATLRDTEGNIYVRNSFDVYYTDRNGTTRYASESGAEARINTIRLGEYYYDTHVRDMDFTLTGKNAKFKADKNYHVYADRLYEQLSLYAVKPTTDLQTFGAVIRIPADTVTAVQIRDAAGIHGNVDGIDAASVEYAAFDIAGTGVFAVIIPSDGSTGKVTVTMNKGYYIIDQTAAYTPGTGINQYDETGGYQLNTVTFGRRLYTDRTHSFEKVDKAAWLEHNPLTGIAVKGGNGAAKFLGYNALNGAYTFSMRGAGFNTAYANPDLQFAASISMTGDGYDRDIVLRTAGENGCLEAGALLSADKMLLPVDVQVCKNFQGDGGEPFYSVLDRQYGDCYIPLHISANKTETFTVLNLYQNWGKYPLKQLSSIEYYKSYYHISTGTTESNCIQIYSPKSFLPDFRGRSGTMWKEQPQFNSVGTLRFVNFQRKYLGLFGDKGDYGEYVDGNIRSVGQTYSDITNRFAANCGAYTYELRHVEFPQTDENRTFYQVKIDFLSDITFSNFRRDFNLFYIDGNFVTFNKCGYLDENNTAVSKDTVTSGKDVYHALGSDHPYFGFYSVTEETDHRIDEYFGSNCAFIVRGFSVEKGGKAFSVPLTVRENGDSEANSACLTLDTKKISFTAGDSITVDMILLPWGTGRETNDDNVRAVRFDSALHPMAAASDRYTVQEDAVIPTVKSENNRAEFTVTGGKNNVAVKVTGFTKLARPQIQMEYGGVSQRLALPSSNGYDGYSVKYEADGTYTYSFVYTVTDPEAAYNFTVEV
ncbi:MAG: hypothetical protein K5756_03155 [Clostridiales bacterium]|nr:hypothetical protein [Clostridiales bacterium]